ncbi:30S ribosomal protein S18 [Croceiramulus getboli]|nr:30S ribosomal protein S18 [Flavobacteriaceae bacterium YJPT1-3]
MATLQQQAKGKKDGEIRYLTPLKIDTSKTKKYCRFKRSGIKYIDYKDADFLAEFVNEQGKLLPRRLTGTSLKYQRKVSTAVKRARHLALMPYVTDLYK